MRFMIAVKATRDTEAGKMSPEDEKLFAAMATYHEELAKSWSAARCIRAATNLEGLAHQSTQEECVSLTDGPFTEAKELIAGYTIIQVRSREEAREWTKRFPNPMGEEAQAEIEVRQLYEPEDFGPGNEVERFRDIEARKN